MRKHLLPTSRSPTKLYKTIFVMNMFANFGSQTQKSDCTATKNYLLAWLYVYNMQAWQKWSYGI